MHFLAFSNSPGAVGGDIEGTQDRQDRRFVLFFFSLKGQVFILKQIGKILSSVQVFVICKGSFQGRKIQTTQNVH